MDTQHRGIAQNDRDMATPDPLQQAQSPSRFPLSPPRLVPQKRSANAHQPKTKVTRACDICKAKKSKCSGEQPCQTCDRRGLECRYESNYARGKPPSPLRPEQHGIARVQIQQRRNMDVEQLPNTSFGILSTQYDETIHEAPSRASPGLEVAGQYSEPTSGLSFLNRAWKRITNTESSQLTGQSLNQLEESQRLRCAGDKPLPEPGQIHLPSEQRAQKLLDSYFNVCIATYRMLHRPTTESWLATVLQNETTGRPFHAEIGRARAAVVLSLLAVASFHEEKAKQNQEPLAVSYESLKVTSDELFIDAARLSETETGFPRLESAQSRLIQVLFLLMSCRFNQAWYTFGHALQIVSALGLHRKDNRVRFKGIRRDYIEEQCRKRTFWVAYILDKYISVIFGRPRHYHDDDIDQDLPEPVNDEDMTPDGPSEQGADDCHLHSLIHHAELAMITESILREVYSIKQKSDNERFTASHQLGRKLRQWKASLPPFLGAINPNSLILSFRRQATTLRLSYCHALILTYRPMLLKSNARQTEEEANLTREGIEECIAAARTVLESADRVAREGSLFNAYWWTHYICFCALAVVYVWAIQQSNNETNTSDRRNILEKAERCLSHLAQATASNSPSRRYSIILQELRTEAKRKTARHAQVEIQDQGTARGATTSIREASLQPMGADGQMWDPLFGSPIDSATPGLQNFLDNWQTVDWLQLDSSALGTRPEFDSASIPWMNGA